MPIVAQAAVYFTATTDRNDRNRLFLVEVKFKQGFNLCKVTVRSPTKALSDLVKTGVAKILAQ